MSDVAAPSVDASKITLYEMLDEVNLEINRMEIVQKLIEEGGCVINQTERRRIRVLKALGKTPETVIIHEEGLRELVRKGHRKK